MKKYANERDEIVAEFKSFMNQAILNCARNVTRMINRRDEMNGGESLETLDEKRLGEYMATEDRHDVENGIELEITNVTIKINDELLGKLLAGLTEREVQSLVLHEAFDYDFQQIGEMLGISSDRAKAYKYHGMKKAKARAKKHGRNTGN